MTWITAPDFYFTIDLYRKYKIKMVHGAIIWKPYLQREHNLHSNFSFATLYIIIVTGACFFVNARVIALEFEFSSEK